MSKIVPEYRLAAFRVDEGRSWRYQTYKTMDGLLDSIREAFEHGGCHVISLRRIPTLEELEDHIAIRREWEAKK